MPTTTFFNLPAEKREKFLRAAREEFARVPYADASINRIIRSAGIPRGSFYMYFKDKRELLFFLVRESSSRFAELLETAISEQHGDLFAGFLAFYDSVRHRYGAPGCDDTFRFFVSLLRLNAGLHSEIFQTSAPVGLFFSRTAPYIDTSLLRLESDGDLKDIFSILLGITGPALCGPLQSSDPQAARARYVNVLSILKRGMAAPASHEKGVATWTTSN